ncbi:MAG: ParB/RepB/Spo0J family partition protein [Candidatus Cryosericum sp.]
MEPWAVQTAEAVDVERIYYDAAFNCRGEFTLQSVRELADSILQVGRLIYPVLIQPWKKAAGFDYRLIVGYRRFQAVTFFLKWPKVPAIICPHLTAHQTALLNVTENLERRDLNIWEEARALQRLYPKGVTLRRAAAELKQTTYWVNIRLRLLQMPPEVQTQAASRLLSQTSLNTLLGLKTPEEQIVAAQKIVAARQRGKGKRLPGLEGVYKRRTPRVRSKEAINQMVERMLSAGVEGLAPRFGAWCAGYISDDDLQADITAALKPAAQRGYI